jgi:hypothetical protein
MIKFLHKPAIHNFGEKWQSFRQNFRRKYFSNYNIGPLTRVRTSFRFHFFRSKSGLPDFSWYSIPKGENIPNNHKIYLKATTPPLPAYLLLVLLGKV